MHVRSRFMFDSSHCHVLSRLDLTAQVGTPGLAAAPLLILFHVVINHVTQAMLCKFSCIIIFLPTCDVTNRAVQSLFHKHARTSQYS